MLNGGNTKMDLKHLKPVDGWSNFNEDKGIQDIKDVYQWAKELQEAITYNDRPLLNRCLEEIEEVLLCLKSYL